MDYLLLGTGLKVGSHDSLGQNHPNSHPLETLSGSPSLFINIISTTTVSRSISFFPMIILHRINYSIFALSTLFSLLKAKVAHIILQNENYYMQRLQNVLTHLYVIVINQQP